MQIQITQDEIEIAVRNYIANEVGITRPIDEITFTQTRNPTAITAEITVNRAGEGSTISRTLRAVEPPEVPVEPASHTPEKEKPEEQETPVSAQDEDEDGTEEAEKPRVSGNSLFS